MSVKTTGIEFKKFITDPDFWQEGWWHDDEELIINGVNESENYDLDPAKIPDDAVVVLAGGDVYKGDDDETPSTFEAHFKAWRKKQTTVFFAVEVDREKADAVRAAIKAAGGKVI